MFGRFSSAEQVGIRSRHWISLEISIAQRKVIILSCMAWNNNDFWCHGFVNRANIHFRLFLTAVFCLAQLVFCPSHTAVKILRLCNEWSVAISVVLWFSCVLHHASEIHQDFCWQLHIRSCKHPMLFWSSKSLSLGRFKANFMESCIFHVYVLQNQSSFRCSLHLPLHLRL